MRSARKSMDAERRRALEKYRFQCRYCRSCIYFTPDPNVGLGREGGYCDYLGKTGKSRLVNTPPEQLGRRCPMRVAGTPARRPKDSDWPWRQGGEQWKN